MRELGYVEGRNLVIEWRFADSKLDRLAALASELMQLKVDVFLAAGQEVALALQKATSTVPIVFAGSGDPVGRGLVKSLARPGGNITGRSTLSDDLGPKRIEMLLALMPKLLRVAVLVNPTAPDSNASLALVDASASADAAGSRRRILPDAPAESRCGARIAQSDAQPAAGPDCRVKREALDRYTALLARDLQPLPSSSLERSFPEIAFTRRFPEPCHCR